MKRRIHRFSTLTLTEARLFLREPAALFFQMIFPVLLLVLFGGIFGNAPLSASGELRVIDFYLPALIGAFIGQAGLVTLPIALTQYREQGILKRYHASPVSLPTYLFAHVAAQTGALLVTALIMIAVADLLFGIHFPDNVVLVLLVGLAGVTGFFAIGFALSGLLSSPQAATAVGNFLFLTMFFLSGAAFPIEMFPDWLAALSHTLPLTHIVQALAGLWLGDPLTEHLVSLIVLVGLAPLGLCVAKYLFQWR